MERKHSFMVMTMGFWGIGHELKTAAKECYKAGGQKNTRAVVRLIIGDDKPTLTDRGDIIRAPNSELIRIGDGLTLGQLLKLED